MSRDPQRLPDYLGHILEAIERIQSYVDDVDEVGFLSSKIIQDAVIRNLEVIGEASRNIERVHPEFAAAHPELPLALANDMRNALALRKGGSSAKKEHADGRAPTRTARATEELRGRHNHTDRADRVRQALTVQTQPNPDSRKIEPCHTNAYGRLSSSRRGTVHLARVHQIYQYLTDCGLYACLRAFLIV